MPRKTIVDPNKLTVTIKTENCMREADLLEYINETLAFQGGDRRSILVELAYEGYEKHIGRHGGEPQKASSSPPVRTTESKLPNGVIDSIRGM